MKERGTSGNAARIDDILAGLVGQGTIFSDLRQQSSPFPEASEEKSSPADEPPGRFDFDLAEFLLFRFFKQRLGNGEREPLVYADAITGRDGQAVRREWKAYPGPFGFGGATTQVLLYDLIQLYVEQGCHGSQIQFGTLRSLLLRRGERSPSARDYERIRRDLDILRGYDFHCKNAFWDHEKRAYVDMNWRLFGTVFYFKEKPHGLQCELPFGFIEVSAVFQQIARSRGFFSIGFPTELFYNLKPLEQRLAVYLAKKFVSQKTHRRFVDDLAQALPIEAARPRDVRSLLKGTAEGLLAKEVPILKTYQVEKARDGRWLASFDRKATPYQDSPKRRQPPRSLSPEISCLVDRIVEETGARGDRLWWEQCVERLGSGPMERALGQFKEARALGSIRNPGGLLTKICKDLAQEMGIALR